MDEILIILFLILLNGIFAMSEIAVISARKSNLQTDANKGSKSARRALSLSENPDKFLSSVQVGITLIGILTGMVSGNRIADSFGHILEGLGMKTTVAFGLAQSIIIIIVTYFSIVLGELLPKRIGLSASEKVAKFIAGPMTVIAAVTYPLVWILSKSTGFLAKIFGIKSQESKITEDEIKSIIQESTNEGEVLPIEKDLVESVFALGDLNVSSIMTLRNDITSIDMDMDEKEVRNTIENNLYEVYPVIDGDLDHVVGILSLKDVVVNLGKETFDLKEMIREPVYFHENMSVYKVLEEMKAKSISRALICDEFGSCSGIITIKDILEALVGNIDDELQEEDIIKREDGESWLVDGQCPLYDFLRHFDKDDLIQDCESTTIAGLILEKYGKMPVTGICLKWEDFSFEVVDMDGPRIDKIIVKTEKREDAQ